MPDTGLHYIQQRGCGKPPNYFGLLRLPDKFLSYNIYSPGRPTSLAGSSAQQVYISNIDKNN